MKYEANTWKQDTYMGFDYISSSLRIIRGLADHLLLTLHFTSVAT